MGKLMTCLSGLTLAFAIGSHVTADPFGIDLQADTPQSLGCKHVEGLNHYCATLPHSHPDMTGYILRYHDELGYCSIMASGKEISTNRFGASLRAQFEAIKEQLSLKYGEPGVSDDLMKGSVWTAPEDWMIGLMKKERYLNALFLPGEESPFEAIRLQTSATGLEKGRVSVLYIGRSLEKCIELEKQDRSNSF
ncbi:hypothetical protein [Leisingera sp. XS_AS12]|uniref:hypothetical protein n=1 Tax=Leisingera sp. XS_AS12 TaxID=3241294 RepID=UPI00351402ED